VEVVASLSQGRKAAAQCGLFTYKSVPVIFEPPCSWFYYKEICYDAARSRERKIGNCISVALKMQVASLFEIAINVYCRTRLQVA